MRIAQSVAALFILWATSSPLAAPAAVALDDAAVSAFDEFQGLCERDGGRLWGASLCGPMLIVDPDTRAAVASQADGEGLLHADEGAWTGVLPDGVGVANTATEWAGVRWIMLLAPLPQDDTTRRVLLAHEAWHRAQAGLGLAVQGSDCPHLETERGRTLLRLELRALRVAMDSRGGARWRAARDALMFRAARLEAFPEARQQEAALDRNEGLAEYTGVRLGAPSDPFGYASRTLSNYENRASYARSFAYASGPAYGLLLEARRPNWRQELGRETPADMLARVLGIEPSTQGLTRATARYDGAEVAAAEHERAEAQLARIEALRVRFAASPRLILPLRQMQMEFDPNRVTPIPGLGSFYEVLTLRDAWGELRAGEGALIYEDFSAAVAPAPAENGESGPGWSLALSQGFQVAPAASGDGVLAIVPSP